MLTAVTPDALVPERHTIRRSKPIVDPPRNPRQLSTVFAKARCNASVVPITDPVFLGPPLY